MLNIASRITEESTSVQSAANQSPGPGNSDQWGPGAAEVVMAGWLEDRRGHMGEGEEDHRRGERERESSREQEVGGNTAVLWWNVITYTRARNHNKCGEN